MGKQLKVALGPFLSPRECGLREKGEPWERDLGHVSAGEDLGALSRLMMGRWTTAAAAVL